MYRLDYISNDGREVWPVRDNIGRDWFGARFDRARERAIEAAAIDVQGFDERMAVAITRISGGGMMQRVSIAHPDGRVTRA